MLIRVILNNLVLLMWSALLCAEEVSPDTADEQAREQRRLEYVQRESARLEQTNVTRSFRFRVVDSDGNGVAGIPLFVEGIKYRSALSLFSPMQESFYQEVVSGADGYADCGSLTFGTLRVSVRERGLPDQYDSELHEHFSLPGAQQSQRSDGRSRVASGVDFIFYLHRYHGPHALWDLGGEIKSVPLDGKPIPWRLTHPLYNFIDGGKPVPLDAESVAPDFEVRLWRDPAVPLLRTADARPGEEQITYSDGTPVKEWVKEANHWIEITCETGGILPVDPVSGDPRLVREAPVDGYRQRVSWSYDHRSPDRDMGRWPGVPRWFWWRRSTNPPIYSLVNYELKAGVKWSTHAPYFTVIAQALVNPTPGDRWVERPIRRHPKWITDPTRDETLAWLTRIGPVVPMPVQEVPPLAPGWPPRP